MYDRSFRETFEPMRMMKTYLLPSILTALTLASSGCFLAADLVNPNFFSQFGIDPNSITGRPGTIIVNFNNATQFPASLNVIVGEDEFDLTQGASVFNIVAGPQDAFNEVLDCPVEFLSFGTLDADFMVMNDAVDVVLAEGDAAVNYLGANLNQGQEFACGDVINVTLTEVAGDAGGDDDDDMNNQNFALTVEIRRGR